MLTKDQLFRINEFVRDNGDKVLWTISDKFSSEFSEFRETPSQKTEWNKFFQKHGTDFVANLESKFYNLFRFLSSEE